MRQSAIILAGRRSDRPEPLAEAHGVSDKCLVAVGGEALIEHVVRALATSPRIDRMIVSINDPGLLTGLPVCGPLIQSGRMLAVRARGNLADSVIEASRAVPLPALITTADNVLLTHDAITRIMDATARAGCDAAAAFARKEDILAAHPEGQRRFYEFRDGGYSNCNTYWVGNAAALKAVEIFRSGGQFAKNPLRIASAFGPLNLLHFRLGLGSLEESVGRISRRLGLTIAPVIMDDGSLAIDVDNERTHRVVEDLLRARRLQLAA
jgi:GTP:adenosylcobinamide-phosphate guanylyltransferase